MRMRVSLVGALALALAAASPASAVKLNGKSFAIDKKTSKSTVFPYAFATSGANFGVSFTEDTDNDNIPDTLSLQLFKAKGKPDGKKVKVAKGKPNSVGTVNIRPAGVLGLSGGKSLIAYLDGRTTPSGKPGGLYGQVMKGPKTSGGEVDIAKEKARQVLAASLAPLQSGALALWTTYDVSSNAAADSGRFISPAGKPGKSVIDLSRFRSQLSGVSPFGDGFIARWLTVDSETDISAIYGRIYDGDGEPVGPEKLISPSSMPRGFVNSYPMALGDDSIVVFTAVSNGAGGDLTAQLYDGDFSPVGEPKTLVKSLVSAGYAVQPLGGGDFLVGAQVKDGDSATAIAFTHFTDKLKPVGGTARIAVNRANLRQLVTLDNGDALALYGVLNEQLMGQVVKP